MAQNYDEDCYGPTHVAQADLQKMKDNFECLRTTFSGSTTPPLAEGLLWLDTATNILRIQKAGTTGWLGILTGDADQKIWIYRNNTLPGWVIDDTVVDKVLALRGGEYGPVGGVVAGTWTQPPHQHHFIVAKIWVDHNHAFTIVVGTFSHSHTVDIDIPFLVSTDTAEAAALDTYTTSQYDSPVYTNNTANWVPPADYEGITEPSATLPTWRPAAAVGTMQYIDVLPT